jgi:hypothetical protein
LNQCCSRTTRKTFFSKLLEQRRVIRDKNGCARSDPAVVIRLGRYLQTSKELCPAYRRWREWVQQTTEIDQTTANKYISIYNLSQQYDVPLTISVSTLVQLAHPDMPQELRERAFAAARNGELVANNWLYHARKRIERQIEEEDEPVEEIDDDFKPPPKVNALQSGLTRRTYQQIGYHKGYSEGYADGYRAAEAKCDIRQGTDYRYWYVMATFCAGHASELNDFERRLVKSVMHWTDTNKRRPGINQANLLSVIYTRLVNENEKPY